jgi:hypothetical protein
LGDERSTEQWECRQYPSRTVNAESVLHKILLPLFWANLTVSVPLGERNVKPQSADPFGALGQLGKHKIESWERFCDLERQLRASSLYKYRMNYRNKFSPLYRLAALVGLIL